MYDWLSELGPGQWVVDLGSGPGSFAAAACACRVVALDEDTDAFAAAPGTRLRVFAKGENMPFADASIDLVVCQHALEHFINVRGTLAEVARVLKPGGRFYAAVPDGHGLCDAVYRFVFEGGGHVNRFSREELARLVEECTGLRLARWQNLYSSFIYLRRLAELLETRPAELKGRLRTISRLPRGTLGAAQWLLYVGTRAADRVFGTNLSVHGWAFWFVRGNGPEVEMPGYANVCMYCGTGHPAASVPRMPRRRFQCSAPCCRPNPWFAPFRNRG